MLIRKRTWWPEFKSWTMLIAFHIAPIPLGKVWIHLFSFHLWVNGSADWALSPWYCSERWNESPCDLKCPLQFLPLDVWEGKICLLSEPEFMWKKVSYWVMHVNFGTLITCINSGFMKGEKRVFLGLMLRDRRSTRWGRKEKEKKRKIDLIVALNFWPFSTKNVLN